MPIIVPAPGDSSGSTALPEVRASDADRDRVVGALRDAAGDGRLTAEEFGERVEAALTSRTLGELAVLTADLVAGPGRQDVATAEQAQDVIRVNQRYGSVQRTGRWMVPRRLELRPLWCDVTLDFTDAVITYDTLHVDLDMRGGSLILVARPGLVVNADSLTVRYAHVETGASAGPGTPVVLRVQLVGRIRYGRIETRWPLQTPDSDRS